MKPRLNLRRYHNKIWFPSNTGQMCLDFFSQFDQVEATHHAAQQMLEEKRGMIPSPTRRELLKDDNQLIEFYEILDNHGRRQNRIQKMLVRIPGLHERYDYSYLIAREGYIVSAWANSKTDDHRITRALSEYYCPPDTRSQIYERLAREAAEFKPVDNY